MEPAVKQTPSSEGRQPKSNINKKGRIIVRNLSFKATEEAVRNWFLRYGEITDVQLLRKKDGTLVGCGFVQYQTVHCAAKAIKECNAKPFLGRQIVIDWAIPKQQYASQGNVAAKDTEEVSVEPATAAEPENEDDDDEEEEQESDDDEEDEKESPTDSEEEVKSTDKGENAPWKGQSSRISDVEEGKTLFIRNLDFSTSQDSLKNLMEQYGSVHYALLCMDKVMERPRGTGFVKFHDREAAEKCMSESQNGMLQLDGRTIDAVLAVTREDLDKQKLEAKKEHKDKRNLFLAREGYIRPGTRAAQGVSASDMGKRQQNELWKKQMLRNLHMYISRERLCVHNLPPRMTDKQLLRLFLKHSNKGAKIVEARIMRDLKVVGEGNVHPSKSYGFVTFSKHEDALLALRNINNNPTIFTNDKRPIVEFSIENRAAVKAKMLRIQKSLENVDKGKKDEAPTGEETKTKKKKKAGKSTAVKVGELSKEGTETVEGAAVIPDFSGAKADPKIKGLPSHSGPKIRHRKRPAVTGSENGSGPMKKPKISRKMFKNPANRSKETMKKPKASKEPSVLSKKKVHSKASPSSSALDVKSTVKNLNRFQDKKKWFDS